jgi:hypothetical protein
MLDPLYEKYAGPTNYFISNATEIKYGTKVELKKKLGSLISNVTHIIKLKEITGGYYETNRAQYFILGKNTF